MQIKPNKKFTTLTALLMLLMLVAGAVGYITVPMHFNMHDEPYQIMCGWDYRSSVVAPLSAWITSTVGPLWHFDCLPFHILGWTLHNIAVLIAMLPVWWLSRNINTTLAAGTVSIFLLAMCRNVEWIYNWDSYAAPMLIAVAAAGISYCLRRAWWKIAIAGAFCAVLTMLRMPSIVAVALPLAAILSAEDRAKQKIKAIACLLAIFAITAAGILIMLYGSVGSYVGMIKAHTITAHSSDTLSYVTGVAMHIIFIYAFAAAGVVLIVDKLGIAKKKTPAAAALTAAVAICFYIALRTGIDAINTVMMAPWFFLSPLYVVAETYLIWKAKGKMRTVALIALMATLASCVGSNVPIYKMAVFQTMPIIVYLMAVYCTSRAERANLCAIFIPILALSFENETYVLRSEWKSPVQPAPHHLRGVPHMRGMWVNWWDYDRMQRIADRFMPFVNDPAYNTAVMRNGGYGYFFEYIFDSRTPFYSHFWDDTPLLLEKDYTDRFTRWIESSKRPVAVLIVRNPNAPAEPQEEIIGEYMERYRTVYSDRDFTIVIREPQITSMSDSRR